MEITLTYKLDVQRKLCITKDLLELSQWIDSLSSINTELEQLKLIEKKLLKISTIETNLLALRRKNTLIMGMLCKYEQELKTEHQYGKTEYDFSRAKEHEKKRDVYSDFVSSFNQLRISIYLSLLKYQRR